MRTFLFLLFFPWALFSKELSINISAPQAILIDAKTGMVLYQKRAHERALPASTTKLAVALYAHRKLEGRVTHQLRANPNLLGTVSESERLKVNSSHPTWRLEPGGTHMWILPNELLSYDSLFKGLLLCSANDAANVIAENVGGSIEHFMDEMNLFLHGLGMKNTHFVTPSGLHHPDHYTTAYDMALLGRAVLKNSYLAKVCKMPKFTRSATNMQPASEMPQHNRLVKPGRFYYPKATGLKTGTIKGGYYLVASAKNEERSLVAVVLNAPSNDARFRDTIKLFDAAFDEPKKTRRLFAKKFDLFSTNFRGAKDKIEGALDEDLNLTYYESCEPHVESSVKWNIHKLPIHGGDEVGCVEIIDEFGQCLVKAPLFAACDINPTLAYLVKARFGIWAGGHQWLFSLFFSPIFLGIGWISVRSHRRYKH